MRDWNAGRGGRAAAVFYGSLFCAAALTAAADYDSTDKSGNLQDECKEFSAVVVRDTSFTVSAVCNDKGTTGWELYLSAFWGTRSTSFDLSGDVSWDTSEQKLAWDATLAGSVQDITATCRPANAAPFTVSASDVTLALTCSIQTYGGGTQSPSLALNGKLTVAQNGTLKRR